MTREEQIDWLCRLRADLNNGVIFTPWNKEFSEAINDVLEQEPTTKNDLGVDLIAKPDAINAVSEALKHTFVEHEDIANKIIGNLPSVTTKNNLAVDCISRDAVKYYIQAHIQEIITESGIDKNAHTNRVLRALLNGVDTMPSVTPQPRKGHWIPTYGNVKCSVCGSVKDSREVGRATHYCDFCGAKMEVEE